MNPKKINLTQREVKMYHWEDHEVNKNIENLIHNWKEIRNYYPGWVVLPNDRRLALWSDTEYQIGTDLSNTKIIEKPNDILILHELFWRYDKCLIPLSVADEKFIEDILSLYNPYPAIYNDLKNLINPNETTYKDYKWDDIKEAWIFLNQILISDSRRDLNIDKFFSRISILRLLIELHPELSDFINYELCLFYLSKFDETNLSKSLDEWKITEGNNLFNARKAAILAEIGLVKEAKNLALNTLDNIRKQYIDLTPDYYLMSLEGWVMMLNRYLDFYNTDALFDLRLDKLGFYKCDSFNEFDELREKLKMPEPKNKPIKEEIGHFDQDVSTIRSNLGNDNHKSFFPAFSFLRIFEETCIPMQSYRFNIAANEIFSASTWIKRSLPMWSLSCVLRSNDKNEEILDEFIDRFYIATLPDKNIRTLVDCFLPSLDLAINNLQQKSNNQYFTIKTISTLSDLLSKIVIRNPNYLKSKLFKIVISLFTNPISRNNDELTRTIRKLFKRLIETINQDELIEYIPMLINLPVADETGFKLQTHNYWYDPFEDIEFKNNVSLKKGEQKEIEQRVDKILSFITTEESALQRYSILRIAKLISINALNENQIKKFVEGILLRKDDFGVPITTLYDSYYLNSQLNISNIKEYLKIKYLKTDIPKISNKVYEGEKVKSISSGGSGQTFNFIRNLLYITERPFLKVDREKKEFIVWNEGESLCFLDKLIEFWDYEKDAFKEDDEYDIFSRHSAIKDVSLLFDRFLSSVVIPNLNFEHRDKLMNLLMEFEERKIQLHSSIVLSLKFSQNNKDDVVFKILKSLDSLDNSEIRNSLDAILLWLSLSDRDEILNPPIDFVNEIINRIIVRRQPGLLKCLFTLEKIIEFVPNMMEDIHYKMLYKALEYLLSELDYKNYERSFTRKSNNKFIYDKLIDYRQLPKYRSIVSEITFIIFSNLSKESNKIPEIILKWMDSCKNDPLPEIRNLWFN